MGDADGANMAGDDKVGADAVGSAEGAPVGTVVAFVGAGVGGAVGLGILSSTLYFKHTPPYCRVLGFRK